GDPGQITADRADELGAELIVVGSHGRTGLSRLVLGSTAERVTRLAHCAVLVVKLEPESAEAAAKSGEQQSAPVQAQSDANQRQDQSAVPAVG
ncbi:MAG TPA: hypothetical protein DDW52_10180, partial [Planctomycetaceae bacterium]|nr:hypothetical protein [Planctomycetaceae bacterium]